MQTLPIFTQNQKQFQLFNGSPNNIKHGLPAGNYMVCRDQYGNFFLEQIDAFSQNTRNYGSLLRNRDRIISTFFDRKHSTGVMFTGEKGSGKSLLAKEICIELLKHDVPTLIINTPFTGDPFNQFIQSITQPCVVMFDEFEKVYDDEEQEKLLTLLDGVFPTKKLFILTSNNKWKLDKNMQNRPGRIYYMIDFDGLSSDFIKEYCDENLKAEYRHYTHQIIVVSGLFSKFNFDMLKALVEEINRYGESPRECLTLLNVKPEFDEGEVEYSISIHVDGVPVEKDDIEYDTLSYRPLVQNRGNNYRVWTVDEKGERDYVWERVLLQPELLSKYDPVEGSFEYKIDEKVTVTATKNKTRLGFNYLNAF